MRILLLITTLGITTSSVFSASLTSTKEVLNNTDYIESNITALWKEINQMKIDINHHVNSDGNHLEKNLTETDELWKEHMKKNCDEKIHKLGDTVSKEEKSKKHRKCMRNKNKSNSIHYHQHHYHSSEERNREEFDEAYCIPNPNVDIKVPTVNISGVIQLYKRNDGRGPLFYNYEYITREWLKTFKGDVNTTTFGFDLHSGSITVDGNCSSAGGHFHPHDEDHEDHKDHEHHEHDESHHLHHLNKLQFDKDGKPVEYIIKDYDQYLSGKQKIVGRSIMIHLKDKSLLTIACCTIKYL